MNINAISFGKTVKVYAPYHDAVRTANAANGDPTVDIKVQRQVKSIFNDTKKGHAVAFTFDDDSNTCYIFSGEESKKYVNNLHQKALKVRCARKNFPTKLALTKILEIKKDFEDQTISLIQSTQAKFALKIFPEGEKIEILKPKKNEF